MRRRAFLAGLGATLALGGGVGAAAAASGLAERIVAQLRRQGYPGVEVSRTWLGRTRIRAQRPEGEREIILDPRTGEILRDLWMPAGDTAAEAGDSLLDRPGQGAGPDDDDGPGKDGSDDHDDGGQNSDRDSSGRDGSDHDRGGQDD